MKLKPIFTVLIFLLVIMLQLAIEGGGGFFAGRVNLILVALVIFINLFVSGQVIFFAVLSGLILDTYSGLPFGLLSVSFLAAALAGEILFVNFFTNFSLYSLLILEIIVTLVYYLLLVILMQLLGALGWVDFFWNWDYLVNFLGQVVFNSLLAAGSYFLINFWSKRFKPIFLS